MAGAVVLLPPSCPPTPIYMRRIDGGSVGDSEAVLSGSKKFLYYRGAAPFLPGSASCPSKIYRSFVKKKLFNPYMQYPVVIVPGNDIVFDDDNLLE